MHRGVILLFGGRERSCLAAAACLEKAGHSVRLLQNPQHLGAEPDAGLVELAIVMCGKAAGLAVLRKLRSTFPQMPAIAVAHPEAVPEVLRLGAQSCVLEPLALELLIAQVERALEHVRLRREIEQLRGAVDRKFGFHSLIGGSDAFLHIVDTAARAARADSPILIRGEQGTGKELLAKAIHFNSARRQGPFVIVNCAGISAKALDWELFGAAGSPGGKLALAHGGTLYLEEPGHMPQELQTKLLLFLRQHQAEESGGAAVPGINVRLVAATRRNLQSMVEDGDFREDLYYALAVIPLELPPLRDHADDIPALARHFFAQSRERQGRPDLVLPESLLPRFVSYRWPGNVQELEDVIDRLVVACGGRPEITVADLPEFLGAAKARLDVVYLDLPPHGISLEAVERTLILRALQKSNWNQSQAARYLDLSCKTLIYRMDKFGLRSAAKSVGSPAAVPSGADGAPQRQQEGTA